MAQADVLSARDAADAGRGAPRISVVVTVYNEAATLEELYRRTAAALAHEDCELIFVDDGSTDGGFAVLERLNADSELRLIPVIVLTGRRLTAAERRELRTKTVSLLEKSSYSAKELRTLIERALAQQPLDRLEQL